MPNQEKSLELQNAGFECAIIYRLIYVHLR